MPTIHLNSNDETAKAISAVAFPAYNGRKFKANVVSADHSFSLISMWDGGSRDYYAIVRLSDMTAVDVSEMVGAFNREAQTLTLPEGFALVEHSIFCGKDSGITIYVQEANATKLIPAPVVVTHNQRIVLAAIRSRKSSYAGIKNYRQHESGLPLDIWNAEVEALKSLGFLTKTGAITPEGKNVIGLADLDSVKREQ